MAPAVPGVPGASAQLRQHGDPGQGAAGPVHRRRGAHLRDGQHDRRGVRSIMADPVLSTAPAPPPATVSDSVTVTIDGKVHQFPKGTNLLEACNETGANVPYFCYHAGLTSPA